MIAVDLLTARCPVLLNNRSTRSLVSDQVSATEHLAVYPQVATFVVVVHSVPASTGGQSRNEDSEPLIVIGRRGSIEARGG